MQKEVSTNLRKSTLFIRRIKLMKSFFFLSFFLLLHNITHGQETYVPDDNFEIALINLGYDALPLNDYIPTANISDITYLNVSYRNIGDLTGIEDFTSLTSLSCSSSPNFAEKLTSLDVSNNTTLTSLVCAGNNLTSLDVSNNVALTYLSCAKNNLTSLDVTMNTALTELYCFNNSLTSIDISINNALTHLNCGSNSLISLNVKNGNNAHFIVFNARFNPDLSCIQVDNVSYSNIVWIQKDPSASYSLDCNSLGITSFELENYKLYPNPTSNLLNIKLNNTTQFKKAAIYNYLGQLIKEESSTKIDVSKFSKGVYFAEMITTKGSFIKKFIVK